MEPTTPPVSRTGFAHSASRGRPLNLGISIPPELLQDSDAIRLAKAPKLSTEMERASDPQAPPVAETSAELVTEGGSEHAAIPSASE